MVIEPTAQDLLAVFFRRKRAFFLTYLLVIAAGIAYLALSNIEYRSDAQVVVRFGDNVVPDLSRNTPPVQIVPEERRNIVMANVEILRSPELMRRAIENFGIENVYPAIAAKTQNPEQAMELAVRQMQQDLLIDPGEKGDVISISLMSHDRHLSQQLVQFLIDEYKRREAQVYSDPQMGFQKSEVDKAKAALDAAQTDLETFKRNDAIVNFDDEVANLLKQRSEMAQTLNATQAKLSEASQRKTSLESSLRIVPPMVAGGATGERYRGADDAQTRLADLRMKEQQLLSTYRPSSPVVQQLHQSVAEAEAQYKQALGNSSGRSIPTPNPVYQTLQTDYMHALADIKAGTDSVQVVQQGLDAVNQRLSDLNKRHEGLVERQRAVSIAEDTYKALSAHYNDSQVTSNLNSQNIFRATVLSPPTLPFKPAKPRVFLTLAATLCAGLILALFAVYLMEMFDSRFRTTMQVVTALELPVLACIGERPRQNNYLRLT